MVPDQILKFRDDVDDSLLKDSGASSSFDEYISSEKIKPIRVEEKIHVSQYGKQIIWEKYESIVVDQSHENDLMIKNMVLQTQKRVKEMPGKVDIVWGDPNIRAETGKPTPIWQIQRSAEFSSP